MKVLLTYASSGAGHRRAAEAVYDYIRESHPETEVEITDVLAHASAFFKFNYGWGYSFLARRANFLWRLGFWLTDCRIFRPLFRPLTSFINRINTKDFARLLIRDKPDYIISTHFLTSEIAAYLKQGGQITAHLATVVTDFGVHYFWVSPGTDTYIVASQFAGEQLLNFGIEGKRIKQLGIPIDPKFSREYNRVELSSKFGIDAHKFTLLVMTGSFGSGPLEQIAESLCKEAQVLVVCANNKKLYARLNRKNLPNMKAFGLVNNPEELMAVSDMIVTKPGGLTISELLAMELPPLFISAIPGQEENNVKVLRQYGIGISAGNLGELARTILHFKSHPEELISIKEKMRKVKKPSAAGAIFNAVCKGGSGPAR